MSGFTTNFNFGGSTVSANLVAASKLNAAVLATPQVATQTVSSDLVEASTVSTDLVDASTVTTDTVTAAIVNASDHITTAALTANTLSAAVLTASDHVTTGVMNADTVNTSVLNASTFGTSSIDVDTVNADTVNAGTVNTSAVTGEAIIVSSNQELSLKSVMSNILVDTQNGGLLIKAGDNPCLSLQSYDMSEVAAFLRAPGNNVYGLQTTAGGFDVLVCRDTLETLTNKIIHSVFTNGGGSTVTLPTSTSTLATIALVETFSNKNLSDASCRFVDDSDQTKRLRFELGGATPGRNMTLTSSHTLDRTLTLPDVTDTLVARTTIDTFSNKTLSAPVFSGTASGPLLVSDSIRSSSPSGGVGYASGAGGTVTQAVSKSTGVTISPNPSASGQIVTNAAALAASTSVSFVLTDSAIGATDILVLNHASGGTAGAYTLNAQCLAGSATITIRNVTLASLAEAITIRFALIKSVTS